MNIGKKDNKGRVLKPGESQRKDGRYRFTYTDDYGTQHDVYSWRLTAADPLPRGKRECLPLRELEREVQYQRSLGIKPKGGGYTVYGLVKRYVGLRLGVTESTKKGYNTTLKLLETHPFGRNRIDQVKESDAKEFLVSLQRDKGKSGNTVRNRMGVLRPAFEQAVRDDLIRKNPFDFCLRDLLVDDSMTRFALSPKDQRRYLEFIKGDAHFSEYYDGIFILFSTGIRIGELCGLTLNDVNLDTNTVSINHCMHYSNGKRYIIEEGNKTAKTKTAYSLRELPICGDVAKAFKHLIDNRRKCSEEPIIDGFSKFLFINRNGNPSIGTEWEHYFTRSIEKFNNIYKDPLPKFTPHTARHTYCTNMARTGMRPDKLQQIMGHADIRMTMQYYNHVRTEDVRTEVEQIYGKDWDDIVGY